MVKDILYALLWSSIFTLRKHVYLVCSDFKGCNLIVFNLEENDVFLF